MPKTIKECADYVRTSEVTSNHGIVKYFAIKFYGECWISQGPSPPLYYEKGLSTDCFEMVGGSNTIYMYHFGPKGILILS